MNIQQIYELAVKLGIEHDLRGEARVRKILRKTKERYEKLTSDKTPTINITRNQR